MLCLDTSQIENGLLLAPSTSDASIHSAHLLELLVFPFLHARLIGSRFRRAASPALDRYDLVVAAQLMIGPVQVLAYLQHWL